MPFCFMKQFFCAKHKAKLKHDANVCQHTCNVNLVALSVIKKHSARIHVIKCMIDQHHSLDAITFFTQHEN